MYRIAICDDEEIECSQFEQVLEPYIWGKKIDLDVFYSGEVSSGSTRAVYFIHAVYPKAGMEKSAYTQDSYRLIQKGQKVATPIASSTFSPKYYFRLLLNVYGDSTVGGIANGKQADYKE